MDIQITETRLRRGLRMKRLVHCPSAALAISLFAALLMTCSTSSAQHGAVVNKSPDLATELQKLRAKVADLEASLNKQHQSRYGSAAPTQQGSMTRMSMGGSGTSNHDSSKPSPMKMREMGGMKMQGDAQDADSAGMGGMSGMGMMSKGKMMGMGGMMSGKMMGMGMMGRSPAMSNSSMSNMSMPSALPGFPGASHLYHIGETGFFLDHDEHITLADEQQLQLNRIKEESLLAMATAERKIDEAEQELWQLTAAAEPDINKFESKAREIAQLTVESRIAFIRAVGNAANVLTDGQRKILVGSDSSEASGADHNH